MTFPERFTVPERFNIADYFLGDRIREGHGERPALLLDDATWTYGQVQSLAHRYAHALVGRGLQPEDRVMLALEDGPDFVGALFGTLLAGGVVVMVNPKLSLEEVSALFDYTMVRFCVVDHGVGDHFRSAAEQAMASEAGAGGWRFPALLRVGGDPEHEEAWQRTARRETFVARATHRDDAAMWLFSGGTTGRPKAVIQSHLSFANTTELYAKRTLGYRSDDITLSVPKLFFGYATGSNLFFPFAVGAATVLFAEHPTPEVLFDKIARHRPTLLINVPTLINRMLSHSEAEQQDLSSLRFVTSAGEALPAPLYQRFKDTFGVEVLDGLGTAEMWHIFVTNRPGEVRPGTLGRVVEGFELEVRDTQGRPLPDGEVGRMWVRGDSRALGYWRNMEKTAESFHGPWFVGGDLIRRDTEGFVHYCGRADDVLKVGGKWLVPQEVESCLMRHPEVKECAVVGAQDDQGLTKPFAFVLCRDAHRQGLEDDLKDFALEHLQAYKHPRRVILLEAFPRTHLGKIDRGALKKMI